jgi:triphosphoribosyl-dephospho-CoA synthase
MVSAVAIGPAFRRATRSPVGEIILEAIQATQHFVGLNTNLGIVMLLAPLAKAAGLAEGEGLRAALGSVLKNLTVDDARLAYEAIRLAKPAGMGQVKQFDLHETDPGISLLEAMAQARDRDTIAREYVTDYAITFEIGLTTLERTLGQGVGLPDAIVQTFLSILAKVPDTLIARKNGLAAAEDVSDRAGLVLKQGGIFNPNGQTAIEKFDLSLRSAKHNLNPGTTADIMAAVLFTYLVVNDLPPLFQGGDVATGDPPPVQ